ncbi:TonB-dependent receptor [Aliikangiella sp. IMCC44653]
MYVQIKNRIVQGFLISSLLLSAQSTIAETISGKVEVNNTSSLTNIKIKVRGTDIVTLSDREGNFSLDLAPGKYILDIEGGRFAHFHQEIEVQEKFNAPLVIRLEDESEHKIIVRVNPLEHTALDMATPTVILTGDELTMKRAGTLGDILQLEPGLNVSSFGPSVSRPVIRGLGGGRVQITNNQMSVQDASTTSADHDAGIEPLLAEQIEVVKGPATMLYGSGAIGGVINVSDRRINPEFATGLSGGLEARLGSNATGENSVISVFDYGQDFWHLHFDAVSSRYDDLLIPSAAESEYLHELEEAEGGEHEEGEEGDQRLAHSHSESKAATIGTTFISDSGYIGFAASFNDKQYGVPGHAHHEEEHGAEEHEAEEHEEHEAGVLIDLNQKRYDLQAAVDNISPAISQWFLGLAYTDYEHQELEGDEVGTQFLNNAFELKSYLKHSSPASSDWLSDWHGIIGVQYTERDFDAIGEEAFVPQSVTTNQALYILEEKQFGALKWELGLRFESQKVAAVATPNYSESGLSYSAGVVYSLMEHNKIALNYSHANRFASAEELYSDGEHFATRSYEIGDANIAKEVSNNFDFSYRFESDVFDGEVNLFYNQFNDFIYGRVASEGDACVSSEAALVAAEEELTLICYAQDDAIFYGAELQANWKMTPRSAHQLKVGVIADFLSAKLDSGSNQSTYLPRIPPRKLGLNFNYAFEALSANINWIAHAKQNKIGLNELPTDGFTMLNLEANYRLYFQENDLLLFFKANNLLNEEARDHSSLLKDLAPRAARNYLVGMRYTF